jgi:hypothetical protein
MKKNLSSRRKRKQLRPKNPTCSISVAIKGVEGRSFEFDNVNSVEIQYDPPPLLHINNSLKMGLLSLGTPPSTSGVIIVTFGRNTKGIPAG